jgi:hypothetical protein
MGSRDLAWLAYGTVNTGALYHLLARYGREPLTWPSICHNDRIRLRVAFSIKPKDARATFVTGGRS